MDQWMNSEGHRANILTGRFTSIGIGCVYFDGGYTVTNNSKIGKMPIPKRNGYIFTSWYTSKTKGKK